MASTNLITALLPVLGSPKEVEFNVFDVMHHGSHEKQLSNIFRWLLEIGGTHQFEDLGQKLFIELLNSNAGFERALSNGPYSVRQEVNTSPVGEAEDIADIVLESSSDVIVIENYHISDGHGHGYDRYLSFGSRNGKRSTVVLLCAEENLALLTLGWEQARIVTYEGFLSSLVDALDRDEEYQARNPNQYAFIRQMYLKFASGKGRMNNEAVLDFMIAMCSTGEARRYQILKQDLAAEQFANDLAQQGREHFVEGRSLLQDLKQHLRTYGEQILLRQLNTTLGHEYYESVWIGYAGIYQWTIDFKANPESAGSNGSVFQIKFGPSAWYANEDDPHWQNKVPAKTADYARLFITDNKTTIFQSSVTLHEVLCGLSIDDHRLHDEIIEWIHPRVEP